MPRLNDQELAELLEAADEARSFHGRGVGQARQQLYDLAPALAQEVLARRRAGQALAKAAQGLDASLWELVELSKLPSFHVDDPAFWASIEVAEHRLRYTKADRARWAELTETEVGDERTG